MRSFLRTYCVAAAKCADNLGLVVVSHRLIDGVPEELELHAGYAESLGIDLPAMRGAGR
ncbi:MAG: hypothetical protein GY769_07255 [bacterium]|nr:hypothetical protein [bacterium]